MSKVSSRTLTAGIALAVGLLPHLASGQTPQPSPSTSSVPYQISVRSQIVVMDVVVRDHANNPVRGLTSGDFTVLDNGVPQRIISFDPVDTTKSDGPKPTIESTAELDRVAPNSPVNIIVLDEITTLFEDEYFARYSLDKYLKSQGDTLNQPTILMARTVNRLMVLSDYTTSKRAVMDALNRHLVGSDWKAKDPSRRDEQIGASFASLIEIARATQGHSGHKNLIWVGRGFPPIHWQDIPDENMTALREAVIQCANTLRDSRITLYAIDPAGVTAPIETLDPNGDTAPDDPFGGEVDFARMAQATGGLAIHGRNDVDKLIGQAITSGEVFYTLAFRPTQPVEEETAKFRKISVSMKDSSLTASTREGYYPASQGQPAGISTAAEHNTDFGLSAAVGGLLTFDGIPLQINRTGGGNTFSISFPASSLELHEDDSVLSGDIDLIVIGYDKHGKVVSKSGKVITLHIAATDGSIQERRVNLSTTADNIANTARLRFVIRSHANGRIGAENFFLISRTELHDPSVSKKPAHR